MENLDFLVKLASFGTAGVCVLAIFLIGIAIPKLPNDTPAWKAKLMRTYMTTCIIIAVICGVSGAANAYFNQQKIVKAQDEADSANQKFESLAVQHNQQVMDWNRTKEDLQRSLADLNQQLVINEQLNPQTREKIEMFRNRIDAVRLLPVEEMVRKVPPERRPNR
jgi:biotin synthase-related radical SAM superfamily protein